MTEKIFQPLPIQLTILQSRGIVISDVNRALSILKQVNYYALINGYKDPFIATTSEEDCYKKGTRFEEIWALYEFDRRLRELLLIELLRIEQMIQTNITYVFSSFHGYDHRQYLRLECFNVSNRKNAELVKHFIEKMQRTIDYFSTRHKAISHYVSEYHYVPLWVLSTVLTFGETNQFFTRMRFHEKQIIAKPFSLTPRQFESALHILCAFRNKCAHGERIYSHRLDAISSRYIPYLPIHKALRIPTNKKGPKYGREDVLALLIIMKYFMGEKRYHKLLVHLSEALSQLTANLHVIPMERIYDIMGLPANWMDLDTLPVTPAANSRPAFLCQRF